jgi:hypothetical protein
MASSYSDVESSHTYKDRTTLEREKPNISAAVERKDSWLPTHSIGGIDLGASLEEFFNSLTMIHRNGSVERCRSKSDDIIGNELGNSCCFVLFALLGYMINYSIPICGVHLGTEVEEKFDHFDLIVLGGNMQGVVARDLFGNLCHGIKYAILDALLLGSFLFWREDNSLIWGVDVRCYRKRTLVFRW